MRTRLKVGAAIAIVAALAVTAAASGAASRRSSGRKPAPSRAATSATAATAASSTSIYLQFDNTHLLRDRSNFASDLELMPHLKNFLSDNGTLSDNEHTILISHTAGGILSALTGLYPDRTGQAVSNSYGFFRPNGSVGFSSSFKYWTDITDGGNAATNSADAARPTRTSTWSTAISRLGRRTRRRRGSRTRGRLRRRERLDRQRGAREQQRDRVRRGADGDGSGREPPGEHRREGGQRRAGSRSGCRSRSTPGRSRSRRSSRPSAPRARAAPGITFTTSARERACERRPVLRADRDRPDRRHDEGLRRRLAGVERGARLADRPVRDGSAREGADRLRRDHDPLRGRRVASVTASSSAKRRPVPPGRAGRLHRASRGSSARRYVNPAINDGSRGGRRHERRPDRGSVRPAGLPGFDGVPAKVSLGYVAQMQEAGVPVTFGYVSRTRTTTTRTRSRRRRTRTACSRGRRARARVGLRADAARVRPGVRDVLQRASQHDGITKRNTLFVVTADENDHFAGGSSDERHAEPHVLRNVDAGQQCPANQIGEVNANLSALIPSGQPNFSVHNDSAPTVYVNGDPARTDATLRQLERDVAAAKAIGPVHLEQRRDPRRAVPGGQGRREDAAACVTADPQRTPSFTLFGNPDYFLTAGQERAAGAATKFNCPDSAHQASVCVDYHFAWSHGDATEDIGRTWLGMAGPGVRELGDHEPGVDRTTRTSSRRCSSLAGPGGQLHRRTVRVVSEFLECHGLPHALRDHESELTELGLDLQADQRAVRRALVRRARRLDDGHSRSGSPSERQHVHGGLGPDRGADCPDRDALAGEMRDVLNEAAFGGHAAELRARSTALALAGQDVAHAGASARASAGSP